MLALFVVLALTLVFWFWLGKKTTAGVFLKPGAAAVTVTYTCNACTGKIKAPGIRYNCTDCNSADLFDLCEACFKKFGVQKTHFPNHRLHAEKTYDKIPHRLVAKQSCAETVATAFRYFSERPFLGVKDMKTQPESFFWLTYREVYERCLNFGFGLKSLGLTTDDFVGICATNCVEWYIADYGLILSGFVTVPVHTTLDLLGMVHVLKTSQVKALICTSNLTDSILSACQVAGAKVGVVIEITSQLPKRDDPRFPIHALDFQMKSNVWNFETIENLGQEVRSKLNRQQKYKTYPKAADEILTIMYTSGSSGFPKGATITDHIWNQTACRETLMRPLLVVDFQPLAHSLGRKQALTVLCNGGQVGIHEGGMETLLQDIQMLRPTIVGSTPAFWNSIYAQFQSSLKKARCDLEDESKARKQVLQKYRLILGNRLGLLITGGAPTAQVVIDFLFDCFGSIVVDGYGTTETGGISSDGAILKDVDVELIDVPELGYFSTDEPYSRGEICVRTVEMIGGYYGEPGLDNEAFVGINDKKYFKTGDVGELRDDGKIHIVDRVKYIFKLAQGEYVSPERLETVYQESEFVRQIYITGNQLETFTVAVVVPRDKVKSKSTDILGYESKENSSGSIGELSDELNADVINDLSRIGAKSGLQPWEIPQAVLLDTRQWTKENGLLTPSNKKKRLALRRHYQPYVDRMYEQIKSKTIPTEFVLLPKLGIILCDVLPSKGWNLNPSQTFQTLGGDSLAAARLVKEINDVFGVEIAIKQIFELSNLAELEQWIHKKTSQNQQDLDDYGKSMDEVHIGELSPVSSTQIDWKSECTLPNDFPAAPPTSENDRRFQEGDIFLTGANGFLGVFLLKELLDTTDKVVYCLLRAGRKLDPDDGKLDDNALVVLGKVRLVSALKEALIWKNEYSDRIKIIIGDLSCHRFGLNDEKYNELASCVSVIYHNGAHVNGLLPYKSLKPANVTGTLAVLRFAFTNVMKKMCYVSTIAVMSQRDSKTEIMLTIDDVSGQELKNMSGYAQSKYIAEVLISSAIFRGLDCTIFRPGVISGHTKTGISNKHDFINLLLCGLINLRCWPIQGTPTRVYWTPVDYVSKCVVYFTNCLLSGELSNANARRIFHLTQTEASDLSSILFEYSRKNEISIQKVPTKEWMKILDQLEDESCLFVFREMLKGMAKEGVGDVRDVVADDTYTQKMLKLDIPHIPSCKITDAIFSKYFNFFVDCGMVKH